jgi:hypothetical protein
MVHFQSKVVFQLSAGYTANDKFSQIVTLDNTDVYRIHYICETTVDRVYYSEIEKKNYELSVTENFSWQLAKISIIRCQS